MLHPQIGVTTYARNQNGHYELPGVYLDCIYRAGGAPVMLAPVDHGRLASDWVNHLDGLVLTGGYDLDPALYGESRHPSVENVDPARDASELALVRIALEVGLPLFAICRGLQVLNVALGGTLHQHLTDNVEHCIAHRKETDEATQHPVHIEPDSRLRRILGVDESDGASWHHQAINTLAQTLHPVAYAADGVIEAVELPGHPWCIGVQWHPEMSAAKDPVQQRLFDSLVSAAECVRGSKVVGA